MIEVGDIVTYYQYNTLRNHMDIGIVYNGNFCNGYSVFWFNHPQTYLIYQCHDLVLATSILRNSI